MKHFSLTRPRRSPFDLKRQGEGSAVSGPNKALRSLQIHPLATKAAFTLLEMVVALSLFVLLIAGIFSIATGTMELTNDLTVSQERAQIRQNLVEFLRRSFRSMPGESEVRLLVQQNGGTYLPTLNVVNGGACLSPGGSLPPDTSVELYAEQRPGGYLRVNLRFLDDKQTAALRTNQPVRYTRDQPVITLLDNVGRFQWRFFDSAANQWVNNWREPRRPLFAELTLLLDDGIEMRNVFWFPPVMPNPMAARGGAPMGGGENNPVQVNPPAIEVPPPTLNPP